MSRRSSRSVWFVACGCAAAIAFSFASSTPAATYYWTTAVSGPVTAGNGAWDSGSYWVSGATSGSAVAWQSGSDADFYANGTSTVAVNGSPTVGNITFDGAGYTITGGSLNFGSSSVNITANQNAEIDSAIVGNGAINSAGGGVLTLGGNNNSYSGAMTISAGTLSLANLQQSSGLTVGDGAGHGTLLLNSQAYQSITAPLTLNGGTIVGGGYLESPSIWLAIAAAPNTISPNVANMYIDGQVSGPGGLTIAGDYVTLANAANSYSGNTTITSGGALAAVSLPHGPGCGDVYNAGVFYPWFSDVSLNGLNGSGHVYGGYAAGNTLTLGCGDASGTFSGTINDGGGAGISLTKTGSGIQYLNGADYWYGATTINGGTLSLANLQYSSGLTVGDGAGHGTLLLNNQGYGSITAPLTLNGGTIAGGGYLDSPSIWLAAAAAPNTISPNVAEMDINGQVSGPGGLTIAGNYVLLANAANSYSGNTTITSNGCLCAVSIPHGPGCGDVYNAGLFDLWFTGLSLNGLNGSGEVWGGYTSPGGDTLTLGCGNASGTFSGSFYDNGAAGAMSLTKTGSGIQFLNGSNNYSGATTINGGTLSVSGLPSTSGVTINNGATLQVNQQTTLTAPITLSAAAGPSVLDVSGALLAVEGPISGGGALTKTGSGKVYLFGPCTYAGDTTIASGSILLVLGNGAEPLPYGPGVGNVNVAAGATLYLDDQGHPSNIASINGLSGSGTVSGWYSDETLAVGCNDATSTFAGTLQYLALTKTGSGVLTLSGANAYQGGTTVNGGVLVMGNDSALGSGTAPAPITVAPGATLDIHGYIGGAHQFDTSLTIGGSGVNNNGALLNTHGGGEEAFNYGYSQNETVNLTADTLINLDLDFGQVASGYATTYLNLNGHTLTKAGSGNYFAYTTSVGSGNLNIVGGGFGNMVGCPMTITGTGTVTVGDGAGHGTLMVSSQPAGSITRPITLDGGTIAGGGYVDSPITLAAAAAPNTISPDVAQLSINGQVSGPGGLTIAGNYVILANTANSYSGNTTIASGGVLGAVSIPNGPGCGDVHNDGSLILWNNGLSLNGLNGSGIVSGAYAGGQMLTLDCGDASGTFSGTINDNGAGMSLTKTGSGIQYLNGWNGYTGTTTINDGTLSVASLHNTSGVAINNGATLQANQYFELYAPITLSAAAGASVIDVGNLLGAHGAISGSGALTKTGTGSLYLYGPCTYAGDTTIAAGSILAVLGNGAEPLPYGPGVGNVNVAAGATLYLDDQGHPSNIASINGLSGSGTVQGWFSDETLAVGCNDATSTFAGTLQSLALVKTGSGVLTLSGANAYGGGTTVNGGMLVMGNDSALGSGTAPAPITVAPGATLDIHGYIGGAHPFDTSLTLGGSGVNNNGALLNTHGGGEEAFNNGYSQNETVNLTADTLVNLALDFGQIGPGYVTTYLNLNGYTLTKAGSGSYFALTTSVGNGNLNIVGGAFGSNPTAGYGMTINGTGTVTVGDGAGNGALALYQPQAAGSITRPITINGGTILSAANSQIDSPITLNAAATANTISPTNSLTLTGQISGLGGLNMAGPGLLALTAGNIYNGPTTISAGTLQVANADDRLPTATALTIASGGVLDLGGNDQTVGSLSGSAGAVVTDNTPNGAYTTTLTVNAASGSTTFAGNIIDSTSEPVHDSVALVLSGSSELTLSGTNTYSGGTTVSGGTLVLADASALPSSGLVTIGGGGWLELGGGSGIDSLFASSARMGGHESAFGNMATLGGAPSLSQGGEGSAVGDSAPAVPEPGTIVMLLAGLLPFAWWRRR